MSSPFLPLSSCSYFPFPFQNNHSTLIHKYALLILLLRLPTPFSSQFQFSIPRATHLLLFRLNWSEFLNHQANRPLARRFPFPELLVRIVAHTEDAEEIGLWEAWICAAGAPETAMEGAEGEVEGIEEVECLVNFEWSDILQVFVQEIEQHDHTNNQRGLLTAEAKQDLERNAVCVLHAVVFPRWPSRWPIYGVLAAQVRFELEENIERARRRGLLVLIVRVATGLASGRELGEWRERLEEARGVVDMGVLRELAASAWIISTTPEFIEMSWGEEMLGNEEQNSCDEMEMDTSSEEDAEMRDLRDDERYENLRPPSRDSSSGNEADIEDFALISSPNTDDDYFFRGSDVERIDTDSGHSSKASNDVDMTDSWDHVEVFGNQYDKHKVISVPSETSSNSDGPPYQATVGSTRKDEAGSYGLVLRSISDIDMDDGYVLSGCENEEVDKKSRRKADFNDMIVGLEQKPTSS